MYVRRTVRDTPLTIMKAIREPSTENVIVN
jgi:hypothetical protein